MSPTTTDQPPAAAGTAPEGTAAAARTATPEPEETDSGFRPSLVERGLAVAGGEQVHP